MLVLHFWINLAKSNVTCASEKHDQPHDVICGEGVCDEGYVVRVYMMRGM